MKLTIGTPHSSTVDGWFFGPWTDIHENPVYKDKLNLTRPVSLRSGPDMPLARGRVAGTFLEGDGDVLCMVDSDMSWSPETICQMWDLYQRLYADGHHILGGLAFILGGPRVDPRNMRPNIWVDDPERGEPFLCQTLTYPRDTLITVAATGAACIMVSREVILALEPNPWAIYGLPDGDRLSEDLSFCRRARDKGYTIHMHTSLRFDHAKTVLVGEPEYLPVLTAFAALEAEPTLEVTVA